MFGLEDRYLKFIKDGLVLFFPSSDTKFYVFGSRSSGKYHQYSDVDIAIDDHGLKIDPALIVKVSSYFENSTFPYEVDIIDLNNISDNFKSIILDDLSELNF